MARRVKLDLELPEELFSSLQEDDIESKVKEALVMELVREHRLSQGKAAELLGVSRYEMFDLMTKYHVPVIDFTSEELKTELQKLLPRS